MRYDSRLQHALPRGEGLESVGVESSALLMLLHRDGLFDVDVKSVDFLLPFSRGSVGRGAIRVDDEDEAASDVGVLVDGRLHVLDLSVLAEMLAKLFVGDLGRDAADEDLFDLLLDGDFLDGELATLKGVMLSVVDGQRRRRFLREQDESEAFGVAALVPFDADVRDWAEATFEVTLESILVRLIRQLRHEHLQLLVRLVDFIGGHLSLCSFLSF